jgi:uncharacterized protein YchJ
MNPSQQPPQGASEPAVAKPSPAASQHVHGPDCHHDHDHGGHGEYDPNVFLKKQPVFRTEPKVGRNDPCPCGSGKKYKKCHG